MRKFYCIAAFVSTVAFAAPSLAAPPPAITFTPSVGTIPSYVQHPTIRNFGTGAVNGTPYIPGAGESAVGLVNLYSSNVPGEAIGPPTGTGNFLAIMGGFYAINFGSTGAQFVSFLIGGLDSYNSVTLTFLDGTSQTLTGRQIIGQSNAGEPTNSGETGRVSYDFGGHSSLSTIIFFSSQRTFEIDEIATAAPEPTTWAMMILGFGIVGGALRRKRRDGSRALA